jgi:phosphoribosylglycinamide formyltransferase-1
MNAATPPLPVVILISGRGSNLQSIIDAVANDNLPIEIRAVISNRPAAGGLQRADRAGITTAVVTTRCIQTGPLLIRPCRTVLNAFSRGWSYWQVLCAY